MKIIYSIFCILYILKFINCDFQKTFKFITDENYYNILNEFEDCAEKIRITLNVPGFSIAVIKNDKLIYAKGFGIRNNKNETSTPETIYPIASMTKAFTSGVISQLVDKKKLTWKDPIKKWIPEFEMEDEYAGKKANLIDIMSHRTGLPRYDTFSEITNDTRINFIKRIKYLPMNEEFRTQFQYNNIMFMVAGEISSRVSNTSWEDLVINKIFKPLNMINSNTRTYPLFDPKNNVAGAFFPIDEKFTSFKEIKHNTNTFNSAAGSIISNVIDMSQWLRMLINKGKYNNITIIPEKEINQIFTPHMISPKSFINATNFSSSYGLGWFIDNKDNNYIISHGGNLEGSSSFIAFWPELDFGVVVLSNRFITQLPEILSLAIYELFFNKKLYNCNKYQKEGLLYEKSIINIIKKINMNFKNNRINNTLPTFPLEKYEGYFEHLGYDVINIILDNEKENLKIKWFDKSFLLEHYHYNTFFAKIEFGFLLINFNINDKKSILGLSIKIESAFDNLTNFDFKKIDNNI
jgi:CubicO group peptidase (beta-lactamase class C family)